MNANRFVDIVKFMLAYSVGRMFVTLLLLVLSGLPKKYLVENTLFFGGMEVMVMVGCFALFCVIMMIFRMDWRKGLGHCMIVSLAVCFWMNIFVLVFRKNDYFLLAMFRGLEQEVLIVAFYFIAWLAIKGFGALLKNMQNK